MRVCRGRFQSDTRDDSKPGFGRNLRGVCLTSSEAKELKGQRVRFGELLYRGVNTHEDSVFLFRKGGCTDKPFD